MPKSMNPTRPSLLNVNAVKALAAVAKHNKRVSIQFKRRTIAVTLATIVRHTKLTFLEDKPLHDSGIVDSLCELCELL
jgi:hypothetical protein